MSGRRWRLRDQKIAKTLGFACRRLTLLEMANDGTEPSADQSSVKRGILRLQLPSHDGIQHDRVRLFANILQRLEWRLRHDASAIRRAFDLPLDTLSGRTPTGMLGGSLDDLRRLRAAIDTIEAPAVKWYRVGH